MDKKAERRAAKARAAASVPTPQQADDAQQQEQLLRRPRTRSFDVADDTAAAAEKKLKKKRKREEAAAAAAAAPVTAGDDDESIAAALPVVAAASVSKRARAGSVSGPTVAASASSASAAAAVAADPASVPDAKGNPPLSACRLSASTKAALVKRGITHLFPIQVASFDHIFDGRDMIGRARTGMGKTLAFALPIIERLLAMRAAGDSAIGSERGRGPRVVVLAPTRELAKQVAEDFEGAAPSLAVATVYGGTSIDAQKGALWKGVDIIVGTPGRVLDLLEGRSLKLG